MSSPHHSLSAWKLFSLAAGLILCGGGFHSAFGQADSPYFINARPIPLTERTPNPSTTHLPKRIDKTQQAVENAIKLGNQARDVNDYQQALTQYQQVQRLKPQDA